MGISSGSAHGDKAGSPVTTPTPGPSESDLKYRLLAENSVDVVWQMNLRLRFTYISPSIEQLTGHTPEEWIGTRLRDHATRAEYRKMARQAINAARNYREFKRAQFTAEMLRKDGSAVPVEIVGRLLLGPNGLPTGFQGSTRDISERVAAQVETARLYQNQVKINELSLALGSILEVPEVYEAVYRHVASSMDTQSLIISSYDAGEKLMRAAFVVLDGERFDESKLPPIPFAEDGGGTQSEVIRTGEPLYLPDYRAARATGKREYTVDGEGKVSEGPPPDGEQDVTRSAILVPVKAKGSILGVMQVHSCRFDAYTQEDVQLLAGLANVTAVAIENNRLLQLTKNALHSTVEVIGKAIELRDPYTSGHQRRVTELAIAIAEALGFLGESIEGLRIAAMLHDIGKISVPAETLSKPGALSVFEYRMIQTHPETAFELLRGMSFPWPVGETILQHHERLDGSGYPKGIAGDDIRLEARILGVADVVEAMSSHRPYRPALGVEAALAEIEHEKSRLFDPVVVDACVRLFREDGFEFSEVSS